MKIIKCLNNAIDYIEDNLAESIEIDEIAKVVFISRYHFQRMFYAVTGFTLAQYIRNRKLTLADEELTCKEVKVSDIALKYGYQSIED